MSDFEILPLSSYNPEIDIIITYVYVGKMPPSRAKEYLEEYKKQLNPIFEKRGFDVIYVAKRNDNPACEFKVDKKEDDYDAMEQVENLIEHIQKIEEKNKLKEAAEQFDNAKTIV